MIRLIKLQIARDDCDHVERKENVFVVVSFSVSLFVSTQKKKKNERISSTISTFIYSITAVKKKDNWKRNRNMCTTSFFSRRLARLIKIYFAEKIDNNKRLYHHLLHVLSSLLSLEMIYKLIKAINETLFHGMK